MSSNGIRVRTFRLDDLFADLSPSLIKCDVEDRELDVIRGARNLIEYCHPEWLMEVCSPSQGEVMKLMAAHGYAGKRLHKNRLFITQ